MPTSTAKARWSILTGRRSGVIDRARQCAEITIPSVLPPEGHTENSDLPTPFQALGARGVNNLASKMLLVLLPTTTPFFRMRLDKVLEDALKDSGDGKTEIEAAMRSLEDSALRRTEKGNLRTMVHAAIKHMIVTGNALIYMPKKGNVRMYRLSQFCIQRDASGNVTEILIQERASKETLSDEVAEACKLNDPVPSSNQDSEDVEIYTWLKLVDGRHEWYQEINEIKVPGSDGRNSADKSPFIPLRWSAVENEDYGRGLVEEYLGDFRSLESLSKSMIQFAEAASRVVNLVDPNSTTDIDELAEAANGAYIHGEEGDVTTLQLDKGADFRASKEIYDEITQRLSHAFLLRSGTVRNAERVTAEEIRAYAQELEDVLGGTYTVQTTELQLPIAVRIIEALKADKQFPQFPKLPNSRDAVSPTIVTGFDALGRGHELNRKRAFFGDITGVFGPQALEYLDIGTAIKSFANDYNIDPEGLIKSSDQVAADRQQSLNASLMDKAAGPVAGQLAKGAVESSQGDA